MPKKPIKVTVAGGGIAGMTAALELARRGYKVTLYEDKPRLGGNVGAHRDDNGVYYDVYPHMFSTFYKNFWHLVESGLGMPREKAFEPRDAVKILRKDGTYVTMTDGMPVRNMLENLFRGVEPPADMLLWVYSMLDLMSQPTDRRGQLGCQTVESFVRSRPYGTGRAVALHDYVLMVVWSAHAYGVSAAPYKDFFRFSLRRPSPLTWVLRGDLHTCLIAPIEKKLEELGVEVKKCQRVTKVVVEKGVVSQIEVRKTQLSEDAWEDTHLVKGAAPRMEEVENLILAVGPKAVGWLAQVGETGHRLVDAIPGLSETRQARAEPIAVLALYFKEKLPDIPSDHVSLWDSPMNLSFLDVSQVWDDLKAGEDGDPPPTVLIVAASNYYGLSSSLTTGEGGHQNILSMVHELEAYLPQVRGAEIDFERTNFHTNLGDELFINDVASEQWRPKTCDEAVSNLFLAGGYCANEVGMATVEAATTTGLLAARALHERSPLGREVETGKHEAFSDTAINAMKLALMPLAYQAKWWSASSDLFRSAASLDPSTAWAEETASLYSLPTHFMIDFWETSTRLWMSSWTDLWRAAGPSCKPSDG